MPNPSPKLIIVANLGRLRAFRLTPNSIDNPRPFKIEEFDPLLAESIAPPTPVHSELSDQAGRFPAQGGPGMSAGDSGLHEREQENERKQIHLLAESMNATVTHEKCETWNLAAPAAIFQRILDALDHEVRERLTFTDQRDYTKLPLDEIETIFSAHR